MASAKFDALIEAIYGAVGRPAVWNEVLATISKLMNSERTLFYIQDLKANKLLFSATYQIPSEMVELFERDHLNSPITFPSQLETVGEVGLSSKPNISTEDMERTDTFQQLLAPLNIYHGTGALVLREESAVGIFTAMRSREAGAFAEDEEDVILRLTPHLARAAQLHYRFLATEVERAAAVGVLDRLTHAVVICDGTARIMLANASAKTLLDKKRGLRKVGGNLAGGTAAQSSQLVAAIRAVADRRLDTACVVFESESDTFRVMISRASAGLRLDLQEQADLVLISFSDPATNLAASVAMLKDLLQLTDAEARAALGLAQGKTQDELSANFGVSLNTIRSHVAAAFGKTQTARQADLVRLVLRTVGPFGFG